MYIIHILCLCFSRRALYSGIVPGLQRQMAFSAIRLGAYERVRNFYMDSTGCE